MIEYVLRWVALIEYVSNVFILELFVKQSYYIFVLTLRTSGCCSVRL